MFTREADRCVRILDNLSLRGSVWPSTCATALKELRQALTQQSDLGSFHSTLEHSNQSPNVQIGVHHAGDTEVLRNSKSGFIDREIRGNNRANTVHSLTDRTQSLQEEEHLPQDIVLTSQNRSGDTAATQALMEESDFQPISDLILDWRSMGIDPGMGEGTLGGFNDIFQLMDVSYQMSEQMFDPMSYITPGI